MVKLMIMGLGGFGLVNGVLMIVSPTVWLALPDWLAPKGSIKSVSIPDRIRNPLIRATGCLILAAIGLALIAEFRPSFVL